MRSDIPTFVHRVPLRASIGRSFFELAAVGAMIGCMLMFILGMASLGVFGALYLVRAVFG